MGIVDNKIDATYVHTSKELEEKKRYHYLDVIFMGGCEQCDTHQYGKTCIVLKGILCYKVVTR